MTKKSKLKLLFKSLFVQLGSVKTDEGVQLIWDEDTELMVGYNVYIEQETESGDLEYVAAPDGEYKSGNTTFVIENGVCTDIRNEEAAEPEAETEVKAETSEENLEEQPAEQPAEEPAQEQEEPEFDAQKAIEELRAEYDGKISDLETRMAEMKEQLDALLALPQDENAFNKESRNDNQKPLFKTKK